MRKKRALLRENWTSIRANIEEVIKEQNIAQQDFKALSVYDNWEEIQDKIIETFCDFPLSYKYTPAWLWEHFKLETAGLSNRVEYSEQYLDELLDPDERVWFFVNDRIAKFWFYEGNYRAVKTIIAESYWNEFYIASKKYDWLICMTHHEILLATGKEMAEKLQVIKERVDRK
ncbi:MAG: DUF6756 family protein [Fluviicola sp.]